MIILIIEILFSLLIVFLTLFITKILLKKEKIKLYIINHKFLHPNYISYYRIPFWVISVFLFNYYYETVAILFFTFFAITDAVDWMIARECKLFTEWGKSIDPLADKLFYFAPIIYFWLIWKLNIYLVLVFIFIDILWQFSRILLKKLNLELKANNYWKIKTTFVFIIIYYLMIIENKNFINIDNLLNNFLLFIAIIFALLSIIFKFQKKL